MEYEEEALRICNEALLELGQKVAVRSLEESDDHSLSPNELVCAAKYEPARLAVMHAHKWSFATEMRRVACTPFAHGFDGFKFRFMKPQDCLRICEVEGYKAFQVVGDWVLVRRPVHSVKYIKDVKDPTKWSAGVRAAVVRRLAADIAVAIQGGSNLLPTYEQFYQMALGDAKRQDASEGREFDYCGMDPISLSMEKAVPRIFFGGYSDELEWL